MPDTLLLPRIARRRSKLHGWGVFAGEAINKNRRIIDFAGELIDHKESLKRESRYLKRGEILVFTVNRRWVRDANSGGNVARFINHGCAPNCYTQIIGHTIWIRGPDVGRGRRQETDANHRIIGRYAAPIRRSARTRSILPHRSSRLPVAPPHSASLSRPPERMWTDGRPPAATAKEGPIP